MKKLLLLSVILISEAVSAQVKRISETELLTGEKWWGGGERPVMLKDEKGWKANVLRHNGRSCGVFSRCMVR